jgi:hypothetical protein
VQNHTGYQLRQIKSWVTPHSFKKRLCTVPWAIIVTQKTYGVICSLLFFASHQKTQEGPLGERKRSCEKLSKRVIFELRFGLVAKNSTQNFVGKKQRDWVAKIEGV